MQYMREQPPNTLSHSRNVAPNHIIRNNNPIQFANPSKPLRRGMGGYTMPTNYTYSVTWSPEDAEHIGLCAEFPSLSWLAPTPDEALSGIHRLVSECLADMRLAHETPPKPVTR